MASLRLSGAIALLLASTLGNSCGSEIACACAAPEPLAGTYHATRLRFTPTGQATVDALSGGATITLTLSTSGATSGTFFVPASLNDGTQAMFDLTGTYQSTGNSVTFAHSADTFIRDVTWTWQGSTLVTTASAGGTQYDVILTRSP